MGGAWIYLVALQAPRCRLVFQCCPMCNALLGPLQTQEMWSFIVPVGLIGLHIISGGQQLTNVQVLLAGE